MSSFDRSKYDYYKEIFDRKKAEIEYNKMLGQQPLKYMDINDYINQAVNKRYGSFPSWNAYAKLCAKLGIPAQEEKLINLDASMIRDRVDLIIDELITKAIDDASWMKHYENLKGMTGNK